MYPFLRKSASMPKHEQQVIFKEIRDGFIYKACGVALNSTDNILISILISTVMVGYYGNYNLIMGKMLLIVTIVFSAIGASVGNIIVKENAKTRYEVFNKLQNCCLLISNILVCSYFFLINDIIGLWLGKEFVLDRVIILAISINFYMSIIMQPLWVFRDATALFKKTKWIMVLCAVLNLTLSIIGGKLIGLSGIIFATAISKGMTYFIVEPKLLYTTYFHEKVFSYYRNIIINFIVVTISFGIIQISFGKMIVDTWKGVLLKGLVICTLMFAVSLIFYFREYKSLIKDFIKRMKD